VTKAKKSASGGETLSNSQDLLCYFGRERNMAGEIHRSETKDLSLPCSSK
jgi:hypothetical protein